MKKLSHITCFTVFMAFFTLFGVNAQITIGNGTAYSEKYPINGYYNYSWSNTIYLNTQINTSGSLNSIAFYVDNSTANLTMNNQKIYVRHTTATGYSSTAYEGPTGFTEVFSGDINISGAGWKTITFTTPFNYNGNDNLEFLFENRDGSYVTTFPYFRYTSAGTGNNRTRRDYQDAQFPSTCYTCALSNTFPNIQLNITACSFNSGTASASPSTVTPGNTSTISISGEATGSTYQWQSSTDNISFTNISGATSNSYEATMHQTKYYRVLVTNAGCSKLSTTATVTADLSSMTTKSIGTSTATPSEKYPFNNYYDYSWSNMIYTASEIGHSGMLSRVSFNVATLPANLTALNQKIYVRHTTANPAFTTNTYPSTSGFTQVFEGTIHYTATGWLEIVFDNQFYYNGTDNLEFLFENRDGSYALDYPTFHTTVMSETRTRRDYQDVSFPTACNYCNRVTNLMNIQMKFFPCSNTAGTASATNANLCTNTSTTINLSGQTSGSTIQWQSSTDNVTFSNISGATSASYNTPNLTQTTYYRGIATKGGCPATSNVVTVNVSSATAGTASATNASICSGNTVTLNLSGQTSGASIQWQFSSDNTNFSDISGATATPYTTGTLTANSYYKAKVTNGSCTVYSNTQTITVNTVTAGTASATNATVLPFGSSTISVTGQTESSTIQWQFSLDNINFANISGATNASYDATNLTQTSYYKAIITSPQSCVATTNTVTVTVDESSLTTKTIGTGTNVFDKYPFNGYYDYSWATMLYKAEEINTTGKLTKVSFYVENSPVNEVMNNQKIYVRHTTTSEYSDVAYPTTSGFTLVYDGTITYNGSGWKEITLQTPFDYNGVDDLEFLFENRDGSWTTTYPTFRGQSGMPENRVKRDFNDASFPATCANCAKYNNLLNIQMKFIPCTIASGSIAATQTTVKPADNIEVILSNQEAGATIQWAQSDDNYNFKAIPSQTASTLAIPMTIKPLYIKAVSTTTCSSHSNIVTITPNNCFVPIKTTGTGTSTTEKYPFDVYYNNAWSSTIYTQAEIGSAGTITSLSFKIANAPDNYVTHNQKIYVRETSANDYPTTDYPTTTGFTLVYDGSITYRGAGWKEIVLTTLFTYNGTSNLEFLFENRDGSYGYDYPTFEYTSGMSTYRTKRDYDDNGFPETCVNCGRNQNVPNVKFKFQVPANPAGTVVVTDDVICADETSELSISGQASGSTIQWQSSANNTDFIDISGATATTYLIENLAATTYYRAVVSLGVCSVNTESVGVALDCPAMITFDDETETGTIAVNIASIVDKVGPYHYIISEFPIPDLIESYYYLKDTIYGDTVPVDSVAFFTGTITTTDFTFSDLPVNNYYIAVFDSRGVRIFDNQSVLAPALSLSESTGMSLTNRKVTSTTTNAKTSIDIYMSETTSGSMSFILTNNTSSQYIGLLDASTTLTDKTTIAYGFSIENGLAKTIEAGVESSTTTAVTSTSVLKLVQAGTTIEYVIDGNLITTVTAPESYMLKAGVGTNVSGLAINLLPQGLTKKQRYFKKVGVVNYYNCSGTLGSFSFSAAGINSNAGYTYTIKDPQGTTVVSQSATSLTQIQTILGSQLTGPGVYTITGTATNPNTTFTASVYLGTETEWLQVADYDLTPNLYSVQRNTSGSGYSKALSGNVIPAGTNGWVEMNPIAYTLYGTFGNSPINRVTFTASIGVPFAPQPSNPHLYFKRTNLYPAKLRVGTNTATYIDYPIDSKIRFNLTTTTIQVFVNNVHVPSFDMVRPVGTDLRYKVNSNKINEGVDNAIASFKCSVSEEQYANLKYELDGYYHIMEEGKIRFIFNQEYDASALKFKIYDDVDVTTPIKTEADFPVYNTTNGANYITLDVSDNAHCLGKKYLHLEVTNEKKEKFYLRFYNYYTGCN